LEAITRIFHGSTLRSGDVVALSDEEARHIRKVLRGRVGDPLEVVDSDGRLFAAVLRDGGGAEVLGALPAPRDAGLVTLYQAVPKGRHMDLVVEKATEAGVGRISPLSTEHGVVRLDGSDGKVERWRRVAQAAARQSLRLRVPEVSEPTSYAAAVDEVAAEGAGVVLHNGEGLPSLEEALPAEGPVGLFVGPEGGWSAGELALAERAGLVLASLGPFRLRSETAGVVAVARACAALESRVIRTVGREH